MTNRWFCVESTQVLSEHVLFFYLFCEFESNSNKKTEMLLYQLLTKKNFFLNLIIILLGLKYSKSTIPLPAAIFLQFEEAINFKAHNYFLHYQERKKNTQL